MKDNQDQFEVLRKIQKKPNSTQRELAEELGFSLGKLNYCLKALKVKGFVKINNFKKNPNKINYLYVLTPKGISEKTKLTISSIFTKIGNKLYNIIFRSLTAPINLTTVCTA